MRFPCVLSMLYPENQVLFHVFSMPFPMLMAIWIGGDTFRHSSHTQMPLAHCWSGHISLLMNVGLADRGADGLFLLCRCCRWAWNQRPFGVVASDHIRPTSQWRTD